VHAVVPFSSFHLVRVYLSLFKKINNHSVFCTSTTINHKNQSYLLSYLSNWRLLPTIINYLIPLPRLIAWLKYFHLKPH